MVTPMHYYTLLVALDITQLALLLRLTYRAGMLVATVSEHDRRLTNLEKRTL